MTKTTTARRLATAFASVAITFTLSSAVVANASTPAADSYLAMAATTVVVR